MSSASSPSPHPTDRSRVTISDDGESAVVIESVEEEPEVCDEPLEFDLNLPGIDNRERAMPVRQGDLTRLLLAQPGLSESERKALSILGRLVGSTLHNDFYGRLLELKELYAPLDPDSDYVSLRTHTRELTIDADELFLAPFEETLVKANYRKLDIQVIEQAVTAPNEMGLTYVPDFSLFEHLVVYVRGYTKVIRECRSLKTRFRKRRISLDGYQRMVIGLKFNPSKKLGTFVRTDVLYLRQFKDVPHVDMEMHLPEQGTKVKMRWIDKAQIASPLAVTLAMKLITLPFSPIAVGALLLAPITAGVNSFFGFHRAKKKHLYEMIHKLYYLTLANNASVLTRIIDSAEDEEYKEAMLAYFVLWRGRADREAWTAARLDLAIEAFLLEITGVEINFEVADALQKLFRLGLAHSDASHCLHAVPLGQAIKALVHRRIAMDQIV